MERVSVTVKLWKANINAIIPQYAKNGDAGMDLTAVSITYDEKLDCFVYDTGICVAIQLCEDFQGTSGRYVAATYHLKPWRARGYHHYFRLCWHCAGDYSGSVGRGD